MKISEIKKYFKSNIEPLSSKPDEAWKNFILSLRQDKHITEKQYYSLINFKIDKL